MRIFLFLFALSAFLNHIHTLPFDAAEPHYSHPQLPNEDYAPGHQQLPVDTRKKYSRNTHSSLDSSNGGGPADRDNNNSDGEAQAEGLDFGSLLGAVPQLIGGIGGMLGGGASPSPASVILPMLLGGGGGQPQFGGFQSLLGGSPPQTFNGGGGFLNGGGGLQNGGGGLQNGGGGFQNGGGGFQNFNAQQSLRAQTLGTKRPSRPSPPPPPPPPPPPQEADDTQENTEEADRQKSEKEKRVCFFISDGKEEMEKWWKLEKIKMMGAVGSDPSSMQKI